MKHKVEVKIGGKWVQEIQVNETTSNTVKDGKHVAKTTSKKVPSFVNISEADAKTQNQGFRNLSRKSSHRILRQLREKTRKMSNASRIGYRKLPRRTGNKMPCNDLPSKNNQLFQKISILNPPKIVAQKEQYHKMVMKT